MFITTPIGVTSTNFVVKRDLWFNLRILAKSFWRHDMKNTPPHLKQTMFLLTEFVEYITPKLEIW